MGLLDQLLGAANAGATNSGPGAPAPETALQGVVDLLHHPQVGGLPGLAQKFEGAGLGHLMSGWVGSGPNPGVSPGQLLQVLGPQRIAEFAARLGVPEAQASQVLSQILPHAVDQMTPGGTVSPTPTGPGAAAGVFDMLKARLLGS